MANLKSRSHGAQHFMRRAWAGRGEIKEQCLPEYQAEIEKYKPKSCAFFQIFGFAGGQLFFVVLFMWLVYWCGVFFPLRKTPRNTHSKQLGLEDDYF